MKKRLFGHFSFVYNEIFSHASGMQNVSKLNHVYAKLQQFFVLNTRLYEIYKNYLYFILFLQEHYILNCKCDTI